uniref:SWIM-type domain-containing protein n=1 Tax=Zea mays TaxID=4577 RepID=C0PJK0_MAIZE|nr:unknown [Zea mays]
MYSCHHKNHCAFPKSVAGMGLMSNTHYEEHSLAHRSPRTSKLKVQLGSCSVLLVNECSCSSLSCKHLCSLITSSSMLLVFVSASCFPV